MSIHSRARLVVDARAIVALGAPLVQIKPDKQEATVRSTEASRAAVEADVQYWTQQVKRLEALVTAGAISRQEFEQAQNSLHTAQARLSALNAQVNEQQVELQYYRVAAPQAGVVGAAEKVIDMTIQFAVAIGQRNVVFVDRDEQDAPVRPARDEPRGIGHLRCPGSNLVGAVMAGGDAMHRRMEDSCQRRRVRTGAGTSASIAVR